MKKILIVKVNFPFNSKLNHFFKQLLIAMLMISLAKFTSSSITLFNKNIDTKELSVVMDEEEVSVNGIELFQNCYCTILPIFIKHR